MIFDRGKAGLLNRALPRRLLGRVRLVDRAVNWRSRKFSAMC